jgi:hypothetical protein
MFKHVHVGLQVPIGSEWKKMSEQQGTGPQSTPDGSETSSTQTSTSTTENTRYIYEDITIGDDCFHAAVSEKFPMTLKKFKMGDRTVEVMGAVSEERTEQMWNDAAVAIMQRSPLLQRMSEANERSKSGEDTANTTSGASGNFNAPGRPIGK